MELVTLTWPWELSPPNGWTWDWGSFAGALVGGIVAAVIALAIAYGEQRRARQRTARDQALQIWAWLCSGWDLDEDDSTVGDAPVVVVFRNASESPVYDFRIRILDSGRHFVGTVDEVLFDCFDRVRPPGRQVVRSDLTELHSLAEKHSPGEVLSHLEVEVSFTDFAGRHWARRVGGLVEQRAAADTPDDYDGW